MIFKITITFSGTDGWIDVFFSNPERLIMENLFKRTSANWARYDKYEYRQNANGILYLTPCEDATMSLYNPIKAYEQLVLDALSIGLDILQKKGTEENIKKRVLEFVNKYGLLGLMTALPTTPDFITYDAVYLPKNHFIKEESISTQEYLSYFFPFEKIAFHKRGRESTWSAEGVEMFAFTVVMKDKPQAVLMSFQKEYAERYDWITTIFSDWAFTFVTSFLYYQDFDELDEASKNVYRKGMECFGGIAPTYHIALLDKPTIVWEFNSLLLAIQMMFSFMLTDESSTIKLCKHCNKIFVASRPNVQFCSPQCKNQYNVYKSRAKDKDCD